MLDGLIAVQAANDGIGGFPLNMESLLKAKLGVEAANREFSPGRQRGPWTEAHPVFYWGVLTLLVLSLGAYILKLLTKVKIDG